jgi:hypothetical protein
MTARDRNVNVAAQVRLDLTGFRRAFSVSALMRVRSVCAAFRPSQASVTGARFVAEVRGEPAGLRGGGTGRVGGRVFPAGWRRAGVAWDQERHDEDRADRQVTGLVVKGGGQCDQPGGRG